KPGALELLEFLRARGVRCVLVTNNSRESAKEVLRAHPLSFDLVWTREDGAMKPSPEAFLGPLRTLGIPPEEAAVVGDSHLDLLAAHNAGIKRVMLVKPSAWMRPFFPEGAKFQEAEDLAQVRAWLSSLLSSGS
ncbi:HAD-IA family hydrolase, partial [Candidatus Bipolaricaulota bacterium]|nr:HAD-IA family hydrolase [Candidatus Bipolaricaulota bacterium]